MERIRAWAQRLKRDVVALWLAARDDRVPALAKVVAAMVAASAVVATLTTLFMGSLSDRVGKRKLFICGGYIIWGLSTMAFGLISTKNAAAWFPALNAVSTAAMMVVVLDCIMTFFGSTANDAAFNAYVTDVTNDKIRGKVESVLAVLPLVSMLIIFGALSPPGSPSA